MHIPGHLLCEFESPLKRLRNSTAARKHETPTQVARIGISRLVRCGVASTVRPLFGFALPKLRGTYPDFSALYQVAFSTLLVSRPAPDDDAMKFPLPDEARIVLPYTCVLALRCSGTPAVPLDTVT